MTNVAFMKYSHVTEFKLTVTKEQARLLLMIKNFDNAAVKGFSRYVPAVKALLYKGLVYHPPGHDKHEWKFETSPIGTKKAPGLLLTEEGKAVLKLMMSAKILEEQDDH